MAMTVVLLLLLLAVQPLLLWLAAKVVRIRDARLLRAVGVWAASMVIGLALLLVEVVLDLSLWVALPLGLAQLAAIGWMIKAAFDTKPLRAAGCLVLYLAAGVGVALLARATVLEAFVTFGGSMEPTLLPGDRIMADKLSLRFRAPARGDVIIFHPPCGLKGPELKRVVATAGDKLDVVDETLLVNGVAAGACRLSKWPLPNMTPIAMPVTVPPGKLFVLGDNRDLSLDSRHWGLLDAEQVVGLVSIIYASSTPPPGRVQRLSRSQPDAAEQPRIRWDRIFKRVE